MGSGPAAAAPVRLAVFDCDGTLIDSFGAIVAALQAAWKSIDRDPPAEHLLRQTIGLPLEGAAARLDPGLDGDAITAIATAYFKFMAVEDNVLMPGVGETLAELGEAGVLLGIATGMGHWRLDEVLAQHGLTQAFLTLQTNDHNPGKPDPQMLIRAMAETGAVPGGTVMIGDSVHDMAMARNAGVPGIGVTWGGGTGPTLRLAGADIVIETFAELVAAIDELIPL